MPREDSKTVKEVKVEDEGEKVIEKRKNKAPNDSSAASKSQQKVKKEENKVKKEEADEDSEEPTSKKGSHNTDIKRQKNNKKKVEEAKKMKKKGGRTGESKDAKKREKKVFDLPGQKRDPPDERDPLRIFYETLYKQVPVSEMAATWMMESGLLPKEVAKKIFDRKQERAQQQNLSSPMQNVVNVKKKGDTVTIEKKSATSPAYTQKKKTPDSKVASKQSKKCKSKDESSEDDMEDDDFVVGMKVAKKQRVS